MEGEAGVGVIGAGQTALPRPVRHRLQDHDIHAGPCLPAPCVPGVAMYVCLCLLGVVQLLSDRSEATAASLSFDMLITELETASKGKL